MLCNMRLQNRPVHSTGAIPLTVTSCLPAGIIKFTYVYPFIMLTAFLYKVPVHHNEYRKKELAKYGWDSYNVKILLSLLSVCSVLFFVYLVTIAIRVYAFISNMFVSLLYISFVRFIIAIARCFFAHIN
jgi:hypothetical protein